MTKSQKYIDACSACDIELTELLELGTTTILDWTCPDHDGKYDDEEVAALYDLLDRIDCLHTLTEMLLKNLSRMLDLEY